MRLNFSIFGTAILLLGIGTPVLAQNHDYDDPSARIARLNDVRGELSYSPAGEDEWLTAVRNRPLIRGDRIWADEDTQAELQIGGSMVRLGSETAIELLDIDDQVAQIQLAQGSIIISVRQMYDDEWIEVATPVLAFTIKETGRYRIDVDPYDDATTVSVWDGGGEAFGDGDSLWIEEGETVRFFSDDLRDFARYRLPREDEFDRYSDARDRDLDRSPSLRYVGYDVVGYSDLDRYGSWQSAASYGNVWFPERVDSDWAPYRDGHWVWQEPWGWTWVDNAPWGFAPSHYGRWVHVSNRWGWLPGPRTSRAIYAPALVAFVGGSNWSVSLSFGDRAPVGWFPLGPRDVYVPSYRSSRRYFGRVNQHNTVINTTIINNYYTSYSRGDGYIESFDYAHRRRSGALTAVPRDVFVNARSVRGATLRVDRNAYSSGQAVRFAAVAPISRSVIGAGAISRNRPGRESFNRSVLARHTPPPVIAPFARREAQLRKNPGRPLDIANARSRRNGDRAQTQPQQVRQIAAPERARGGRAGQRQAGPVTALPQFERGQVVNPRDRNQGRNRDNHAVRGQQPTVREPAVTQPKPGRPQRDPETGTRAQPATVPAETSRAQRQRETQQALIRQQEAVNARYEAEQREGQAQQQRSEQQRQQRETQTNRAAQQQQVEQARLQQQQQAEQARVQRQRQVEQNRVQQVEQAQAQERQRAAREAQQQQQQQTLLQQRQRNAEVQQERQQVRQETRQETRQQNRAERVERAREKQEAKQDKEDKDAEDRESRRRNRD